MMRMTVRNVVFWDYYLPFFRYFRTCEAWHRDIYFDRKN